MNTKKRFLLGLVSSLLLACGFVKAAERLDPSSPRLALQAVHSVAPDTSSDCTVWPPQ